ncbi:MAG: hypothetical protein TREMPRED_000875 [Tremellales sp. Tagirdzhanova-0007]|nr:MAG: hypothetical protein TREMPRED_000875 [Tremellales sp. Tagirdzhanova-0007]
MRDEGDDPVDCLKARQYRQTTRVLEREKKALHEKWYFTSAHNIATLNNLTECFLPIAHPSFAACPDRPLVISGWWYTAVVLAGDTSGEVKQLRELGISFIAVGPYVNWIEVAEMMPDVYRFIWNSDVDTVSCITDPRCIAKKHYVPPVDARDLSVQVPDDERGVIPIWMLQVVDYWGSKPKEISNNDYWWGLTEDGDWSFQPLGLQWIATPWRLPGHVYLPYSIEEFCLPIPTKSHAERDDSVLILAKRSAYFHYHYVSPPQFWTDLAQEPDYELLTTARIEDSKPLPPGLNTMGPQTREDYEVLVGGVKALLGMGAPPISPSVYSALCQATPVIIPYFTEHYRTDGWNQFGGLSQHGPAITIGPPYVYSYYAQNYTMLKEVVHKAINTPIDRYIPDDMKMDYALGQMQAYIDRDLEAMFNEVVAANQGKVPRLIKGTSSQSAGSQVLRDIDR